MVQKIKALSKTNQLKPLMFKVLWISTMIMILLYLCFLVVVVNEAVGARQNLKNLQLMGQEYQDLESEFFSMLETIDLDYARELGFSEKSAKVKYAVRVSNSFAQR